MFFYAEISDGKCVGIKQVLREMLEDNLVPIDSYDIDLLGRKYEEGAWGEKVVPDYPEEMEDVGPSTTGTTLSIIQEIKENQDLIMLALMEIDKGANING